MSAEHINEHIIEQMWFLSVYYVHDLCLGTEKVVEETRGTV